MLNARTHVPPPVNEPVLGYLPGSVERAALDVELERQTGQGAIDIPLIIDGREVRTGNTVTTVMPHNHGHVLANVHMAGEKEVAQAVDAALRARHAWSRMAPESRAAVFIRAAELLAGPWRAAFNAATMLNQSKTCHQAEIDASCELIDFFRFNVHYMQGIYEDMQPPVSPTGMWNLVECRPLEGFVYAITPFNFTSIAANLPHAPALMGNTTIWKPSPHAVYSNYLAMKLFEEAGLPPGVINFVPGDAAGVSKQLFAHPMFSGLHYTGSTQVFKSIWRDIAAQLPNLRSYPRIVGETGGKDFIVAHPSADAAAVTTAMIRGGFEYQGQKCSAASRVYVPRTLWSIIKDDLVAQTDGIRMGDVSDYKNFMGAVIHQGAFDRGKAAIEAAHAAPDATVIAGGQCDDARGFFIRPTIIEANQPNYATMCDELFCPILTVHVYDDADYEAVLDTCDTTSPYALTGAIFARERTAIDTALDRLRDAAGNFYINDKPTGAVVGQQPFGGARASGTNDKAGSPLNLLRWVSPRTVKETFVPPVDYRYSWNV